MKKRKRRTKVSFNLHPFITLGIGNNLVCLDRALLMLTKWRDTEGEAATVDELKFVLERSKLQEAAVAVFGADGEAEEKAPEVDTVA